MAHYKDQYQAEKEESDNEASDESVDLQDNEASDESVVE